MGPANPDGAPVISRTRSSPASRTYSAPRWFFTLISFTS